MPTDARTAEEPRGESDEELRSRIADLERRLEQIEPRRNLFSPDWLDRVLPADVRAHFRTGSREQLIAARALIDHWIHGLGGDVAGREEATQPARETIRIE